MTRRLVVAVGTALAIGAALASATDGHAETAKKPKAGAAAKPSAQSKAKPPDTPAITEPMNGPEVFGFRAFCDEWMGKLRERERYNTEHIAWEKHEGSVVGEYTAYSTDCDCNARAEPGKDPIGKITYREMRYRRQGATQAEAASAPSAMVEQSEVTEIFRYGKGRWQY